MMGEPGDPGDRTGDKAASQLLKRRKTGNNILRRLSLTGNKKRESIIYKQMKDDDDVDEALLDPSSNVRFKRSIIQINRSNSSTPIKDPGSDDKRDDKRGLFERFRASFRRRGFNRSHSSSPNSAYDALESGDEGEDKENVDIIVAEEAEEYNSKVESNEENEIFSDQSLTSPDSVEDRTTYKFSSNTPRRRTWKQRIYSSFRRSKHAGKTKSVTSDTSPVAFKRRYSLPSFKRKKKGMTYEAL